ncbi:MAG TPA: flagellar FlbD family protein [Candidatus Angelobacter sp.]|jgi:flagellar protein FlbD|nr:flagellar FlbD family protein [Candidatus Angelobacter sp.]
MIQLTRLNQKALTVNSDLIKFVENTPDTVITLVSGEKFVVLESAEIIVERVVEFRRRLLDGLLFNGLSSPDGPLHLRQEGHSERRRPQEDLDEEA